MRAGICFADHQSRYQCGLLNTRRCSAGVKCCDRRSSRAERTETPRRLAALIECLSNSTKVLFIDTTSNYGFLKFKPPTPLAL